MRSDSEYMKTEYYSPSGALSYRTIANATLYWAVVYGLVRLWWTVTGSRPDLPPTGDDLTVFSDWGIIALCVATVVCAWQLRSRASVGYPRLLLVASLMVSVLIIVSAVLLLLDVVGLLLLGGSGIPLHPLSFATRVSAAVMAIGLFAATWRAYRRWIADCDDCGRRSATAPAWTEIPQWAFVAAYAAMAAYVTRVLVQFPFEGPGGISDSDLVALGVLASGAGILLPLALVYPFGRIWPSWVPRLAGRAVPRRLVLIPAVVISVGMNVYFGMNFGGLLLFGTDVFESTYPDWFWWSSVGSYVVWGLALLAVTYAYARRTRPLCELCQRRLFLEGTVRVG